jgi:hypothetical protein
MSAHTADHFRAATVSRISDKSAAVDQLVKADDACNRLVSDAGVWRRKTEEFGTMLCGEARQPRNKVFRDGRPTTLGNR